MVLRDRRARPRLSAPSSGPIRVHRWDDLAEDEPHERHAGARAVLPRAGSRRYRRHDASVDGRNRPSRSV